VPPVDDSIKGRITRRSWRRRRGAREDGVTRLFHGWPSWFVRLAGDWALLPTTTRRHGIGRWLIEGYQAELERRLAADEPRRRRRVAPLTQRAIAARDEARLVRSAIDDRAVGRRLN
jgi:hypothetical protein